MQKNVGTTDRTIRFVAAGVLGGLLLAKVITGTYAVILAIAAVILVLTGLAGWCGLYTLLGTSTNSCCGGSTQDKDNKCCCGDGQKEESKTESK